MRVFPLPIAVAAVLCAALAGCDNRAAPVPVGAGDAALGKRLMEQYQCGACHAIPGVGAATGTAGPPLDKFGRRSYIAGRIPNLPGPLADWLVDPPSLKPGTMMPNVGVSRAEARHMAAYLATLR
ncbi:c-type cytochrome [Massilia atriviolacea]|uniref:c-type cytochrome n=1 Tax=Massilia atriviolacea TaxID=2495579 RepID=UPI001E485387|nr:c-type cytochrome [Massilia atriviolacea]